MQRQRYRCRYNGSRPGGKLDYVLLCCYYFNSKVVFVDGRLARNKGF